MLQNSAVAGVETLHDDRGYDTNQAADFLGTTRRHLEKQRYAGRGPKYYKMGRHVRYMGRELRRYMLEGGDAE